MDNIIKMPKQITNEMIEEFIEVYFSEYKPISEKDKEELRFKVKSYLQNKEYSADTFELYKLKGTPSSVIIDQDRILRYSFFGSEGYLEGAIMELMQNR